MNYLPSFHRKAFASLGALIITLGVIAPITAKADSPITSTDFHHAYEDIPQIREAATTQRLSPIFLSFLSDRNRPFHEKLALVNALGWRFEEDLGHSRTYFAYLSPKYKLGAGGWADRALPLTAEELTLLGYMLALENYLDEDKLVAVEKMLQQAVKKTPRSYGAHLIRALVQCQIELRKRDDIGKVWTTYEKLENSDLPNPLRPEANQIIRDYLILYARPEKPPVQKKTPSTELI